MIDRCTRVGREPPCKRRVRGFSLTLVAACSLTLAAKRSLTLAAKRYAALDRQTLDSRPSPLDPRSYDVTVIISGSMTRSFTFPFTTLT